MRCKLSTDLFEVRSDYFWFETTLKKIVFRGIYRTIPNKGALHAIAPLVRDAG